MSRTVTLRKIEPVTHDTRHLVFDKPAGFDFVPGQGAALTLHRGAREEECRLAIVSLPDSDTLEFLISTEPQDGARQDGTAARIAALEPGEQVELGEPFDAIHDRGAGVFIAAGAGIVPFIPILRRRARDGDGITACTLIYCNRTEADIILRNEWIGMDGLTTIFTVTDDAQSILPQRGIDGAFLDELVEGYREIFYVSGPPRMAQEITALLEAREVPADKIVRPRL